MALSDNVHESYNATCSIEHGSTEWMSEITPRVFASTHGVEVKKTNLQEI